jgi:predicted nucleotidyltransferase
MAGYNPPKAAAGADEGSTMIDEKSILELCDRIVEEFHPQRIILFGSYAYGKPAEGSDLDILVVLRHVDSSLRKAVEIVRRIKPRVPVDFVVRTPEEVKLRLQANDFFLVEILSRGRVLYETSDQ